MKQLSEYFIPAAFGLLLLGSSLSVRGQSNIVADGSFESLRGAVPGGWEFGGFTAHVNEHGAAEGKCWLTGGTITQTVSTVTGRTYRIRFAMSEGTVNVKWNGNVVGTVSAGGGWNYTNINVVPTGSVSRVGFEVGGALDDVSVGWMEEPPSIARAVPSRSTYEGGAVTMPVVACGAPALANQWFLGDLALLGETNAILSLTNVQQAMQGEYTVVVSNTFGTVRSLPATLLVQSMPQVPTIVHQPKNIQMTAGYAAGFFVFAVGDQPMFYQWRFNGTNIAGATNSHWAVSPVGTNSAGSYSVMVSNQFGTVLSYGAVLAVQTGVGGGWVDWNNLDGYGIYGIDARVFDVDGVTPMEGPGYVAQLYAGATSNSLHAVSDVAPLFTGSEAGLYFGNLVRIPDVLAYQNAYIQVRVWDKSRWATFEAAAALGGKVGRSEIIRKMLYPEFAIPTFTELYPFKLESGAPLLATAKFYPDPASDGNGLEWLLVGEIGAQYVIESRTPPNDWNPIMLVTNTTGTVTFVDPTPQDSALRFYRAQIVSP